MLLSSSLSVSAISLFPIPIKTPFFAQELRLAFCKMSIPANTAPYDLILAITTIAFVFASAGNGANDVANSYATSVAARTLTMPQAGVLAVCTEFVGAVALGARVTSTIKVR